jgi:hypothetical protein
MSRKVLLIPFVMMQITSSAEIVVDTYLKNKVANKYELFVVVKNTGSINGVDYVGYGTVVIGKHSKFYKKINSNCSSFVLNKETFYTDDGLNCLKEVFSNPSTYAKYVLSREKLLHSIQEYKRD